MKQYICDKCKKLVDNALVTHIDLSGSFVYVMGGILAPMSDEKHYDLCPTCYEKLAKSIDEFFEKTVDTAD